MSKIELNNAVITAIKDALPPKVQILPYLMKLLSLGRESIYRRLRSEVAFTFNEVSTISIALNISVDKLAGLSHSTNVLFDVAFYRKYSDEERYSQQIKEHIDTVNILRRSKDVKIQFATNYIPYVFTFGFDGLTKFRYYKWMHQSLAIDATCTMDSISLAPKIEAIQTEWKKGSDKSMLSATYILDRRMFSSFCNDIRYFYNCRLISDAEVAQLQAELMLLIDHFETLAQTGQGPAGIQVQLYLLSINLNTAYFYVEDNGKLTSSIHIHNDNFMESTNPLICAMHKERIDSLKRYSVLISQTAEMQRLDFFRLQRQHVMLIRNA